LGRIYKAEDWHLEVVEVMARTGCSVKQAATELALPVSKEDCDNLSRRAGFQRLLWEARHRYFTDLANDPNFSQATVVGKMLALSQKLEEEGKHADAADVLLKLAKIQGWTGGDTQISVFGQLTQKDLTDLRNRVKNSDGVVVTKPN